MKTIIAGSRDIEDYDLVLTAIEESGFGISEVISGGARGVDTLGEKYADACGLSCKVFPAEWDMFGKRAGYIRNTDMAEYADALVAIWDGKSRGTQHMINIAEDKNLKVFVYKV